MPSSVTSLQFAVRPRVVLGYLTSLLGVLGALMLVPGAVAFGSDAIDVGLVYLGIAAGTLMLAGFGRLLPASRQLQRNEALATVALLLIVASLLAALPGLAIGLPFIDAWFEATSGITTTGLSTLATVEDKPVAFLFARGWNQWVGGLGVVVLALAVMLKPGKAARELGFKDVEMADVVGGTRSHARRVIWVYGLLTAAGILALWLTGASLLDAVVHTMAAVSTGGFANSDASLTNLPWLHQTLVHVLAFAGAISFHVYYRTTLNLRWRGILDNQLLALLVITTLLVVGLAFTASGWKLGDVALLAVSAQSTAGFSTLPVSDLPAAALLLVCVAMFIGGGLGSTAGGVKLSRFLTLITLFVTAIRRSSSSDHAVIVPLANGKPVDREWIEDVLVVIGGYLLITTVSVAVFLHLGLEPLPSLFEVLSALTTTGLSAGLSGPELPTLLKLVLIADMLLGRVELVAIVILLLPRTWFGRRRLP